MAACGPARLRRARAPSALKIAASTCCGSRSLEQPDVEVEARAARELVQEARHDVGREAADALAREVDVGDDERGSSLTSSAAAASASSAGTSAQPAPARRGAKRLGERAAERAAGGCDSSSVLPGATSSETRGARCARAR